MTGGRLRATFVMLAALLIGAVGHGRLAAVPDPLKGTVTGLNCYDPNRRCEGFLAGADGTALDVDLLVPAGGPYPLVVFVHGWGGGKGDGAPALGYPGDQFFVERGYAVLRYSPRGFGMSWGQAGLADPDREIEDVRSLVSAIVDDERFGVLADRVAVMGASYGGAHAWMLATRPAWTTPEGRPVRVATVVPAATWTNLASSLIPNGREDDPWTPVGSPKLSYLTSLYGLGVRHDPARLYPNYVSDLSVLYGRALAGEPFELGSAQDPIVGTLRSFLQTRSVAARTDWLDLLRNDPSSRVPTLVVQGWTDDLFPASEALRMVRSLKSVSADYPVKLYLGDIGHPRAANKAEETDRIFGLVSEWLAYWLEDEGGRPAFDVTSATTTTGPFDPSLVASVPHVDSLSSGVVSTSFGGPVALVNHPLQLGGLAADPVSGAAAALLPGLGELARLAPRGAGDLGSAVLTRPVDELAGGRPVWYQGRARVNLTGNVFGTDAQYDVRLWDRDEAGTAVLVDRGTTKFVGTPGALSLQVELFGNAWRFLPGHHLVVEVTNTDFPFLRPDNLPSSTILDAVTLDLPVRAAVQAASSSQGGETVGAGTALQGAAADPAPATAEPGPSPGKGFAAAGTRGTVPTATAAEAKDAPAGRPLVAALLAAPLLLATIGAAAVRRRRWVRRAYPRSGTSG